MNASLVSSFWCGSGRYIIAFGVLGISGLFYVNFLEGREQDGYEQGVESASHGFVCTERRLRRGLIGNEHLAIFERVASQQQGGLELVSGPAGVSSSSRPRSGGG